MDVMRAWRAMFLNETGGWNSDAETVIRDLESMCKSTIVDMPMDNHGRADPYRLAEIHAARAVFIKIKRRLFGPVDHLQKRANQNG
jgi:hypothetical protein